MSWQRSDARYDRPGATNGRDDGVHSEHSQGERQRSRTPTRLRLGHRHRGPRHYSEKNTEGAGDEAIRLRFLHDAASSVDLTPSKIALCGSSASRSRTFVAVL